MYTGMDDFEGAGDRAVTEMPQPPGATKVQNARSSNGKLLGYFDSMPMTWTQHPPRRHAFAGSGGSREGETLGGPVQWLIEDEVCADKWLQAKPSGCNADGRLAAYGTKTVQQESFLPSDRSANLSLDDSMDQSSTAQDHENHEPPLAPIVDDGELVLEAVPCRPLLLRTLNYM